MKELPHVFDHTVHLSSSRSCAIFTGYPLYKESALRKAKICRLVLGLLKFSVLVSVFLLSLVFTQSLRNYCSRGSQKCSPSHKTGINLNGQWKNVIRKTVFNPSQCDALCCNYVRVYCSAAVAGLRLPGLGGAA